jgi:hypothetical protein
VSALVMDPYTGEVLAEATYPSYDGNAYQQIAADDPNRFTDPIVSAAYEPGSVFKMLTAIAGLETRTVTTKTKINDTGILKLPGKTHIDDADHHARGWMTFEDGVAYSRNVVAAKVALALGKSTRQSSAILHSVWAKMGFGNKTGIDVAGESVGIVRDPTITQWQPIDLANGAFGQGVAVTPIQLATAFSAMVNGGTLVQPHVVKAVGSAELQPPSRGQVLDLGPVDHAHEHDAAGRDRGPDLPRPDAHQGLRRRRQDRHRPDLGSDRARRPGRLEEQPVQLQLRRATSGRQTGVPDLVVAVKINEGTPTIARVGQLEMPVMSFELFPPHRDRRDHPAGPPAGRRPPVTRPRVGRPVRGPYATLDRVTDPAIRRSEGDVADPRLTAGDLVEATGGRLLAESARPILGGAVDSREVAPGNLFVALPASTSTATRSWPRRWSVAPPRRSSPGSLTASSSTASRRRSSRSTTRSGPCTGSPPRGVAGSTRSSSASPDRSPRPRRRRRSRPFSPRSWSRSRTRATRTTRSGCR